MIVRCDLSGSTATLGTTFRVVAALAPRIESENPAVHACAARVRAGFCYFTAAHRMRRERSASVKLIVTLRDSSLGEKERQYALDRITHLQQYFERLTSAEVILSVEATRKHRMRAEFVVHANRGAILVAQAEDASMFAAIDHAHSEMKREVLRHKERLVDHHRARRAAAARRARGAA